MIPKDLQEQFPRGYYRFDLPPRTRAEAEQILREKGFTTVTQAYVADALLTGTLLQKMPDTETVVIVGENPMERFAYAYLVFPPVQDRDLNDIVAHTYAGCERADDLFMVKEKNLLR